MDSSPIMHVARSQAKAGARQALAAWRGQVAERVRTAFHPRRILLTRQAGEAGEMGNGVSTTPSESAIEAALADVGRWCGAHAGSVCDLALSGAWMLTSVMPPGGEAGPGDDARAHALRQWSRYLDIDAARIESDWVLCALSAPGVALVCAAPALLVHGVTRHARANRVRLTGLRPWWVHAAQRWLAAPLAGSPGDDDSALTHRRLDLVEQGLVTRLRAVQGPSGPAIDAIWSERVNIDAAPSSDALAASRDEARMGLALPDAVPEGAASPWHAHVRDHAALGPVLMGEAPLAAWVPS